MSAAQFDTDLSIPNDLRKRHSAFYTPDVLARIRQNSEASPWARETREAIIAQAALWHGVDNDSLWEMMVGPNITRSWMVWSTGYCAACKVAVPMYTWKIDALVEPWKVTCPHCTQRFPTNDFAAFYKSGLDQQGRFQRQQADESLLYNEDHPDPDDPKHRFGVDDGQGYQQDGERWWFVGAYLIYGQWKQRVLGGIHCLANAYAVTGETRYAEQAAILLDRVADLYPDFDFANQAIMHDHPADGCNGYVSTWHDACGETRVLAMAYDIIFDAMAACENLVPFLSKKAEAHGIANAKKSVSAIRRNIEDRILRDALANPGKIMCNYPHADYTKAVLITVLAWPENRAAVMDLLAWTVKHATHSDGTTGEKGMTDYSSFTTAGLATMLAEYDRLDPAISQQLFAEHPALHQAFRFHIDTRCLGTYYPEIGDSGSVATKHKGDVGVVFRRSQGVVPFSNNQWHISELGLTASIHHFLWRVYELTGDVIYVQRLMEAANDSDGTRTYELAAADSEAINRAIDACIAEHGTVIQQESVHKSQWHLALLRSRTANDEQVAWLHYDSGGFWHGHTDGMNLGLFAFGLDLMPDFGYPPLQFAGGYDAPEAHWYGMAAAHNTVVVDGIMKVRYAVKEAEGTATLWAVGQRFQAVRASGVDMIEDADDGQQYERSITSIAGATDNGYLLDLFRVIGGRDHAKFVHGYFGQLTTDSLNLKPGPDYGHKTLMRNFQHDENPASGWYGDWTVEDIYGYLDGKDDIHLRYTDLSHDATAATCEGWVCPGGLDIAEQAWIPRLMIRRQSESLPLQSTFVGVIEAYAGKPNVLSATRLVLQAPDGQAFPDSTVGVELRLADSSHDLHIQTDIENPLAHQPGRESAICQEDWGCETDAQILWLRRSPSGVLERLALCHGTRLSIGDFKLSLAPTTLLELAIVEGRYSVLAGNETDILDCSLTPARS